MPRDEARLSNEDAMLPKIPGGREHLHMYPCGALLSLLSVV